MDTNTLIIAISATGGGIVMGAVGAVGVMIFRRLQREINELRTEVNELREVKKKRFIPRDVLSGLEDTTAIGNDVLFALKDALEYAEFRIGQQTSLLKDIRGGKKYDEDRPSGRRIQ